MQIVCYTILTIFWIALLPFSSTLSQEGLILLNFSKGLSWYKDGVFRKWNRTDTTPCFWPGIICYGGHVKFVNLSYQHLTGALDPELTQIKTIQVLLLAGNNLSGTIPKQLGNMGNLAILDLSHNRFTGSIPPDIGNASSLVKLYLNNNTLEGSIPPELGNLQKLRELRLDRNKLSGSVPGAFVNNLNQVPPSENSDGANKTLHKGLCLLEKLENVNFAFNYLSGPFPSCLNVSRLSFQWNCFDCKLPLQRPPEQCGYLDYTQTSHNRGQSIEHHSHQKVYIQSALIAVAFLFLLLFFGVFFRYWHGSVPISPSKSGFLDMVPKDTEVTLTDIPSISLAELEVACEDFSNIIGSSSNGIIFKGTLSNGNEIAVTEVETSNWSKDAESDFWYKADRLAKINHKHILKLLGYCSEEDPFTRMLIFEYAPNGTLFDLLHNCDAEQLDWNARMRIIMGVAYGLEHLHHMLSPPAGYSKFDSNSIYLTEDNAAKLVDFDVGKLPIQRRSKGKPHDREKHPDVGDLDADFHLCGLERNFHDFEANIFGFGVLLLELISGRPPYSKETGSIIDWAADYLVNPDTIAYMVDPALRFFNYNQLESLCEIINLCIGRVPNRPNMKVITRKLENVLGITSEAACPKQSPLLWAELALLSQM
ncbi:hypothetical protein KP509_03G017000 [Ceratopteris richardii]|uniref:Protein kinase domain-containing protein n=1 Tax=Ceratopteris richardii TaxID=49495 RepID=A0A8T2UXK5_CERRI|nr:hypothetical protein KP509_03G017000 [Ceratopteris richardii]KAH7440941.1 hypothetical protein KP509_03G017000 [Ceratopteris richardii]KAH7440942.1 hypothetical protein KP509_03G017000 [Ceratopteris richardii]